MMRENVEQDIFFYYMRKSIRILFLFFFPSGSELRLQLPHPWQPNINNIQEIFDTIVIG